MSAVKDRVPEDAAQRRAHYLTGLMWHAGTFLILNVFLWLIDLWGPGGVDWAYIVTVAWGLALAFHALAYWIDGRAVEETKAREYREQGR